MLLELNLERRNKMKNYIATILMSLSLLFVSSLASAAAVEIELVIKDHLFFPAEVEATNH